MSITQQLNAALRDCGGASVPLFRPWVDQLQGAGEVEMGCHLRPPIGTTSAPVCVTGGVAQYFAQSVMRRARLATIGPRR